MLRITPPSREESATLIARYQTAATQGVPADLDLRKATQENIRLQVEDLAVLIDVTVEDCRAKAVALTHLEDVLLWAGKAVFL